jgi:hypothetical protein
MEVRRREVSALRTGAVAVGVVVVVGFLIDRIGLLEDPNPLGGRQPYQPPAEESVLVRIPLRFHW